MPSNVRITPFSFVEDSYQWQLLITIVIIISYAVWNALQLSKDPYSDVLLMTKIHIMVKATALSIPVALLLTSILFESGRLLKMLASIITRWLEKKRRRDMGNSRYQGQSEMYEEWLEWNEERLMAEEQGEEFSTPPPNPPLTPDNVQ